MLKSLSSNASYLSQGLSIGNTLYVTQEYYDRNNGLTIVIPAYNEESRIAPTLKGIVENIKNLKEVLVVFDGNDNTAGVASGFGPKIRVLEFSEKLGRGGAIIEGFKVASSEKICFVDADNSIPWYEIARVAEQVSVDRPVAVGSRWARGAKLLKRESLFKIISGRIWHYLIFLLMGIETKDVQCGVKCFYGPFLKKVLPSITTTNRMFDVSLIYNSKKMGANITEVGIEWSHNENTRMPYLHIIPIMFLYLIGMRFAHSKLGTSFHNLLQRLSVGMNRFH